jgi:hypothetical protein
VREQLRLASKPPAQANEKFPFVDPVGEVVQRIGGDPQVHGRRDAYYGLQIIGRIFAQLTGRLQNQIAAHGIAHQGKGSEAFFSSERPHDRCHIAGKPGVIQRR